MGERSIDFDALRSDDGVSAYISDTFSSFKIEQGYGETVEMSLSDARKLAQWILNVTPYGYRKIV